MFGFLEDFGGIGDVDLKLWEGNCLFMFGEFFNNNVSKEFLLILFLCLLEILLGVFVEFYSGVDFVILEILGLGMVYFLFFGVERVFCVFVVIVVIM